MTFRLSTVLSILSLVLSARCTESRGAFLQSRQDTGTTSVQGDAQCAADVCIGAVVSGTTVQYVLQSTGTKTLGWMAMGFGTSMVGSDMVIMWPNSDGTITLSQRTASGHSMPTVDPSPSRVASASTDLSAVGVDQPRLGYTITANTDTTQAIIWAIGTDAPSSSDEDAILQKHASYGRITLDLTKTYDNATLLTTPVSITESTASSSDSGGSDLGSSGSDPSSSGSDSSSSGSESGSSGSGPSSSSSASSSSADAAAFTSYEKMIIVHAVFCTAGFLLILPAGGLIARYLRTYNAVWFRMHWILQFCVAGPILIVGLALAAVIGDGVIDSPHKFWGVVLFGLYVLQCSLGGIIHFIKPKNSNGRPPQNYLHAVLGIFIIGLAFCQVRTGYRDAWPEVTGRSVSMPVNIIWYIWVVVLPIAYAIGMAFLPRQYRQEAASRKLQIDSASSLQLPPPQAKV